jgi:hypothetical protein
LLGFPSKIIWVRTGNLKILTLLNTLIEIESEILRFFEVDNYGCFEIIRSLKYKPSDALYTHLFDANNYK